jgi:hypothetical protein
VKKNPDQMLLWVVGTICIAKLDQMFLCVVAVTWDGPAAGENGTYVEFPARDGRRRT